MIDPSGLVLCGSYSSAGGCSGDRIQQSGPPVARRRHAFGHEADPRARLGHEVARVCRIGLELAPDRDEEHAHVVGLGVAQPPDLLEQLALGDEPARVACEELDHLPLGGREAHLVPVAAHSFRGEVDGEVGRFDHWCILDRRRYAQRDAQTRHQLVHAERLCRRSRWHRRRAPRPSGSPRCGRRAR